jgi:hypothetical protein
VAVQLVQVVPPAAHASSAAPEAHVPALQQPPLQAVSFVPRHALPHALVLVLHAWPAFVPLAARQSACELHPHVSVVGSHCAPLAVVQTAQMPDPPHAGGRVPATHVFPEQQKPPLHVPSPATPQADVHPPEEHVGVPAPQGAQVMPLFPQAPFAVPAAQLPPLQQPPLHAVSLVPRHPVPQTCVLVLQASPALFPVAAGQSDDALHPHVSVVGSHCAPLAVVHTAQVPAPPHADGRFPATHAPAEQQKPALQEPSPPAPQVFVHVPPAHVGVPAVQVAQARPAAPQAPFPVPATQVVPEQHPPLHAWVASHVLVQTWLFPQASCAGQSAEVPQPHDVPFSHTWPAVDVRQSVHAPPPVPHALPATPVTHAFVDEQQPPLHAVVPVPHVAEQVWLVVLQACPVGQSPAALQPQAPLARQAFPALLPGQLAHTDPLPPHWTGMVPGWHVPVVAVEQHPVGHGWLELQTKVQIPPEQPWAPGPQSLTDPQPHCPPLATGSHTLPCVLDAQLLHVPPLLPHWGPAVPATHVVPEQHPPLHGCAAPLHCDVQRCVVVSQAVIGGQSATELHPQNVEPPLVSHCPPFGLAVQLTHAGAAAVVPQAGPVFPSAQRPALQHPPLQTRFPVHDVEHVCSPGSQASPVGQSVGFAHPPPASPASPGEPVSRGDASAPSSPASVGGW